MTYTYALLPVSTTAYQEIRGKLIEAGYQGQLVEGRATDAHAEAIDMHGLALVVEATDKIHCPTCGADFDPAMLDEVLFHEGDHKPKLATGIVGRPMVPLLSKEDVATRMYERDRQDAIQHSRDVIATKLHWGHHLGDASYDTQQLYLSWARKALAVLST